MSPHATNSQPRLSHFFDDLLLYYRSAPVIFSTLSHKPLSSLLFGHSKNSTLKEVINIWRETMRQICLISILSSFALTLNSVAFATAIPRELESQIVTEAENSEIDESAFNALIDTVMQIYKPRAKLHGATLEVYKSWNDSTLNAYAGRDKNTWYVKFFGGFARHSQMTADAFQMVVCHEVGHHFAGFPLYVTLPWAAAEGQADYFASQTCLPELWSEEKAKNASFRTIVSQSAAHECDAVWKTQERRDLCYRISHTSYMMTKFYASLYNMKAPKFETPDKTQKTFTSQAHPKPQCRLDTYFQGALCPAPFDFTSIPGRMNGVGQSSEYVETIASRTSCMTSAGYVRGVRPRCWFKPATENIGVHIDELRMSENIILPGTEFSLQPTLGNGTAQNINDSKVELTADSGLLEIEDRTSHIEALPAGETVKTASAFFARVPANAQCGSRVPLKISHASWPGLMRTELAVGLQTLFIGKSELDFEIPDRDKAGVHFPIASSVTGKAVEARVKALVSHGRPGDLVIELTTPSHKKIRLHNRESLVKDLFSVALQNEEAFGEWILTVADYSPRETGAIESWDLSLVLNHCN